MLTVPIQPVPAQTVRAVLGGQNCQIGIYQKPEGVFVNVNADGTDVVLSVLAHNAVPIVCRTYAGFVGNLMFVDTRGTSDPYYTGFNDTYLLCYLSADEYALVYS
jgi:hypothetical protein